MAKPDPTDREVAERVVLLRRVMKPDLNTRQFAMWLGVSPQRLYNVENGSPLGRHLASRIREKIPGVTLDWLFYGDLRGIHFELAQRLAEAASGNNSRTA